MDNVTPWVGSRVSQALGSWGWTTGPLGEKPSLRRAKFELVELGAGGGGVGERRSRGTSTVGEAGEKAGEDDEKEKA